MLPIVSGIAGSPVTPALAVNAVAAARPSTPQGKPDQVGSGSLTFLSFNMCKSQCDYPAPDWSVRRDRVARVISESGASVVGVQEATGSGGGITGYESYVSKYGEDIKLHGYALDPYIPRDQCEEIEQLIAPAGYKSPVIDIELNLCSKNNKAAKNGFVKCISSPRIYYKDTVVTQMVNSKGQPAAGMSRLGIIEPSVTGYSDPRAVAWAYFQSPGTGPFLAVSLHMTNEKFRLADSDRNSIARALGPWANVLNTKMGISAPTTVLMADLNSFQDRQPRGAQFTLKNMGWNDAWNAKKRINIQYSTINVTPDTRKFGGWPPKPHMRWDKGAGTRIDYIMAKGPVTFTEYEVMLWTNRDGKFNTDYQASDHQAIRAVVQFN